MGHLCRYTSHINFVYFIIFLLIVTIEFPSVAMEVELMNYTIIVVYAFNICKETSTLYYHAGVYACMHLIYVCTLYYNIIDFPYV